MIKLTNLTKKFPSSSGQNSLIAVNNLNLKVNKGEIFGFIGPNGAGKTTTIKMMVGIMPPSSGSITIEGFSLDKEPLKIKRIIGYIPDLPYVYPYMTGKEFLNFVGELYQVKNKNKKIKKLLSYYHIEKMVNGFFKDFSRGTKQKLAILAAFLHEPQALIIDEPILGLDPESSLVTLNMLENFKKQGGTVFVSSHTLSIMQKVCDRIGIIDQGKLIFEGNIDSLKKRLKSKEKNLENLFLKITQNAKRL